MNDIVLRWIEEKAVAMALGGPVVEFGSLQVEGQEGYADIRRLFPGVEYTGCDIRPGPGVDLVSDMESSGIEEGSVGTVVCLETLEHVRHPWLAIAEIFRILKPGGHALLSVPFHIPVHNYPYDFWRMTPEALSMLLLEAGFDEVQVSDSGESVLWDEAWDKPEVESCRSEALPCPFVTFAAARKPEGSGRVAERPQSTSARQPYLLERLEYLAAEVAGRDAVIEGLRDDYDALARYKDTLEGQISAKNAEMEQATGYTRRVEVAYQDVRAKLESATRQIERLFDEVATLRERRAE